MDVDLSANRIQAGLGVWVTDSMLLKLEYVNQKYNDFPAGSPYAGNAKFSGLTTQFSVSF